MTRLRLSLALVALATFLIPGSAAAEEFCFSYQVRMIGVHGKATSELKDYLAESRGLDKKGIKRFLKSLPIVMGSDLEEVAANDLATRLSALGVRASVDCERSGCIFNRVVLTSTGDTPVSVQTVLTDLLDVPIPLELPAVVAHSKSPQVATTMRNWLVEVGAAAEVRCETHCDVYQVDLHSLGDDPDATMSYLTEVLGAPRASDLPVRIARQRSPRQALETVQALERLGAQAVTSCDPSCETCVSECEHVKVTLLDPGQRPTSAVGIIQSFTGRNGETAWELVRNAPTTVGFAMTQRRADSFRRALLDVGAKSRLDCDLVDCDFGYGVQLADYNQRRRAEMLKSLIPLFGFAGSSDILRSMRDSATPRELFATFKIDRAVKRKNSIESSGGVVTMTCCNQLAVSLRKLGKDRDLVWDTLGAVTGDADSDWKELTRALPVIVGIGLDRVEAQNYMDELRAAGASVLLNCDIFSESLEEEYIEEPLEVEMDEVVGDEPAAPDDEVFDVWEDEEEGA